MTEPTRQREVVGVLLAAGLGTRFEGGNKLLAAVQRDGTRGPVATLAAERLVEAPVIDAVAVLGHEAERVAAALDPVAIETLQNPDYEAGQATSLQRGVAWARSRDADGALFALGDMPWVAASTYRALVDHWRATDADIVVPTVDGRRGNPVVFGARHFDALAAVSGDTGGRDLLEREAVKRVPVDDPGIHRDVDRRDDLSER
jgi:molybdenum cofactor cytidylyltransferase